LSFGTPEEVEAEASRNLEVFGRGGGFVFAPDQNIQPTVPIENLMALLRAVATARGRGRGVGV
jgi:uroporphyrinogen-III decarboxylase